jgi:hypothetical protein
MPAQTSLKTNRKDFTVKTKVQQFINYHNEKAPTNLAGALIIAEIVMKRAPINQ